jgi:hypothetical protein
MGQSEVGLVGHFFERNIMTRDQIIARAKEILENLNAIYSDLDKLADNTDARTDVELGDKLACASATAEKAYDILNRAIKNS